MNKIFKLMISDDPIDRQIAEQLFVPSDENFDLLVKLMFLKHVSGRYRKDIKYKDKFSVYLDSYASSECTFYARLLNPPDSDYWHGDWESHKLDIEDPNIRKEAYKILKELLDK